MKTTDLYDKYSESIQVAEPIFRDFGGNKSFQGEIVTLKIFEDNALVRTLLETDGTGKVLVVDGGGSMRCALLGDLLAALAIKNEWNGVVVYGCIRDAAEISEMDLGVKALNVIPAKSVKRGEGQKGIALKFAGATFIQGQFLYADSDGIVVSEKSLEL